MVQLLPAKLVDARANQYRVIEIFLRQAMPEGALEPPTRVQIAAVGAMSKGVQSLPNLLRRHAATFLDQRRDIDRRRHIDQGRHIDQRCNIDQSRTRLRLEQGTVERGRVDWPSGSPRCVAA